MSEEIEVSNLVTKLSIDDTGVERSMAELGRQMKVVQSEFQAASSRLGEHAKSQDTLTTKADSLSKQMEIQAQRIAKLKKQHEEAATAKGADARETQNLEVKLNKAVAQYNKLDSELKTTTDALNKQTTAWEKASASLDAAQKKLDSMGQSMAKAGQALALTVTAPIAAVGAVSTKASIDFESAFAGVRKTVDATEAEFKRFETAIIDMSKQLPASATEIAGVAEAAGQLGIKNEAIMGFTRTMTDLGVATNMSSEQAATALARLANITQMPQSEFDKLGSVIVALGNNLATTESEIVEMGLRLAGSGKQIGMTEAQILSFSGALSSVGIEAEAGGSAFSKVMINMAMAAANGGKQLNNLAAVAGMSSAQFKETFQRDAAGALTSFIEGLGKMSAAGENTFGVLETLGITEVRMRDALLRASGAGDLFRNSLELGTKAWEENVALTNEANQRYEATGSQLKILGNRITASAIKFGDELVPALMSALDALEPLFKSVEEGAEWFASLDVSTQKTIITIVAMAAAAGPLLIITGKLITSIAALIPVVKGLGTALTFLATNPIGLILTGIAAAVTAFLAIKNSMAESKQAAEDLAQAQRDLQLVQENGITREEIDLNQEKINKLNELTESYQKLIDTAAATDSAAMGNNVLALQVTADELGISLEDLEKTANEFGVSLEFIDENGKIATKSLKDLSNANQILSKAIKDAQRETAAEISNSAKQIATRQQEVTSVENLIKTYNTAKKGSADWKTAQKELISQFPQFASATGINTQAIEGLLLVKQQEIALEWASIQMKARESLQEKQTAITKQQAAIGIAGAIEKITGASGPAQATLKRLNDELEVMRGEATSLQALLDMKPSDFKLDPIVFDTPTTLDTGSDKKKKSTGSKAYTNAALDEAYKQLEHKKRLDQLTLESELNTLLEIKKAHIKTADERMAIEEKIYDVKKQIAERDKELRKSNFDYVSQQLQASYEDILAREEMSAEDRLRLQEGLTQDQILLHKEYLDQVKSDMDERYKQEDKLLNDQIYLNKSYLEKVKSDSRYTVAEKKQIEREVTEEIRKQTNERLTLQKEYNRETLQLLAEEKKAQVDNINNMSKAVQDALKAKYQAEKAAAEESIKAAQASNEEWKKTQLDAIKTVYNARVDAAQKAADAEIERINSVYNAQIEAIQKQLDALNQAEKQRSREELDADDQKKIDKLTSKIDYEHDDYNKAQLQKELNKVIEDMNERHRQEELADTKDKLKEEQQVIKDKLSKETQDIKDQLVIKKEIMAQEYEAQQENINAIYTAQKASLDQQLLDTQAHYAALLEAKAIQAEAEKMIIQGQQEDILTLLNNFGEGYQAAGQTLGEKMVAGFKPMVDEISSMIAGVIAQIDSARSAALETMALAASATSAATASSSSGRGITAPGVVSVTNNFNSPVTSPSSVSAAATKAAQQLAQKI